LSLWDRILEPDGLTTVFQPIFRLAGERRVPFALEALTRGPKGTNVERSDVLFEYVRRKRREPEVDLLSRGAAVREGRGRPRHALKHKIQS
jgi:EAL domain-containing protein (putative c-di-GMP-specific phosphodiesterase class I)